MRLLANFRSNVLAVMTSRKMSLSALARIMGKDYNSIYYILYDSTDVKLRHVEEVCTALGVNPIKMMEE